jgi:hypothetical protein
MPTPASTTQARKAGWKPSFSTTSGFARGGIRDDGLPRDRGPAGPARHG